MQRDLETEGQRGRKGKKPGTKESEMALLGDEGSLNREKAIRDPLLQNEVSHLSELMHLALIVRARKLWVLVFFQAPLRLGHIT
jgi:hypothetical protein